MAEHLQLLLGGYPLDINYLFYSLPRLLQGIMLLVILQAVAKVLLILLDIEDNTRRSARRFDHALA